MAQILPSVLGRVAYGTNLTISVGQGDVAQILPSVLGRWPVTQMSASGKNINTAILLMLKTVESVSYNQHSVRKRKKDGCTTMRGCSQRHFCCCPKLCLSVQVVIVCEECCMGF